MLVCVYDILHVQSLISNHAHYSIAVQTGVNDSCVSARVISNNIGEIVTVTLNLLEKHDAQAPSEIRKLLHTHPHVGKVA